MSRRPGNPSRRLGDGGTVPFLTSVSVPRLLHRFSLFPLSFWVRFFLFGTVTVAQVMLSDFEFSVTGSGHISDREALSKVEGATSCTLEVQRALPFLKKAYGDIMHKVLHVGPDTCSVVSKLLKEGIEAWGVEPYELDDVDATCKSLVDKGYVRVTDIKFPFPYQPKSFSHVIVSDALDYLSPRYLNRSLPELARVSADGVVIFSGVPGQQKAKVADLSKFGRPAKFRSSSWWRKYFLQIKVEENEAVAKKFEETSSKRAYTPGCQVFHLKSHH